MLFLPLCQYFHN